MLSVFCVLAFSSQTYSSSHLLYLETQGVIGYSSAQDEVIFYSLSQEEVMQKPGLGFDYLQKFSTQDRDLASFALQARLALNARGKKTIEPQLYNCFLKLKPHFADLWLGHNRPALGLSSYFDSHGLLLSTLTMQGFGFDRDWGVGAYRAFSKSDLSLSFTAGNGMPLKFKGNYLVASRFSYGILNQDNYNLGFSLAYGNILETMGYHIVSPKPVKVRLLGSDFTYLWNNFENRLEAFVGRKMQKNSYAFFYRTGINLLNEGRLKPEAQIIWWKIGSDENKELSVGISLQATADLAIRAAYTFQYPQKEHLAVMQIYYYCRA